MKAERFLWSNAALVVEAWPAAHDEELWTIRVEIALDRPCVYRTVSQVTLEKARCRAAVATAVRFGRWLEGMTVADFLATEEGARCRKMMQRATDARYPRAF